MGMVAFMILLLDNVIQMNLLSMLTTNKVALNQIYNTAVGERSLFLELVQMLKTNLSKLMIK